ncbi:MAG: branched-chain amino acid ABC transporter permease [Candidatus Woesearchaeota archaeon]|jgi:branched-subunit amino acid ABC-type transport system permease component|nr:branched-chain amino acid ABC transporter permease [Candidatus Woesearchaeota archaeon]MDP7181553.1 branched-chain amino acid ABC transporter permease [Candidatus Woesearchaeota archaeon]MDP7198595.1 branched-chain amino acid ABC transporter permease [Candidatus Woesearchaeota archaeon]MDP7466663.1 branched-chain amino acid ABC transporter permease [Candidatus Woesearchaeota archaeon]MDP7646919.1 branched-chain amino acid ABC transporter permease [Candidatus Woesearchaeota archaeon]
MSVAVQLIMNGLIIGSIYALVATGFSLIYNVTKFVHFAHGSVVAFAAYIFYLLIKLGLGLPLSIILTIIIASIFGAVIDWIVYRPLRKRKASAAVLLIASIGLMILLNSAILAVAGADVKSIPITNPVFDVWGARITQLQVIIIAMVFLLLIGLYFFMKHTKLGKAMRATADNNAVAQTVGINPQKMYTYVFMIGSGLAGVAGILVGLEQNLFPEMGTSMIIKGFTGAVIGGMSSVPGSVAGSLFVGLVENIGIWWLPSGYKDAIAFALLFVFLLFKPKGMFGGKS